MNEREYRRELRKKLVEMEGELAEEAMNFINCSRVYTKQADMEENQIRNLIQVSDETRSSEAVKSFIRYQISRSDKGKAWKFPFKGENFGERLILELDRLRSKHSRLVVESPPGGEDEAFWQLMRIYLGYLNWCFVAQKKAAEEEDRRR